MIKPDRLKQYLWTEKWRPQSLEECCLPKRIITPIQSYVNDGNIPNFFFYGSAGTAKTTLAKVISYELNAETMFIDASSDSGKAMIQNNIVPFASTVSMENKQSPKIIILDESDGLTTQAQQSLRPIIEKYSKQCRFIFTANYSQRILDPIKSRCVCFDFNLTKEENPEVMTLFFKRIQKILKDEGVKEIDKKALGLTINRLFPDYRRIMNTLQMYVTSNGVINDGIVTFASGKSIAEELYPLIKEKKFDAMRKIIVEGSYNPEDVYDSLFKYMPEYIEDKSLQAVICICLAKYSYQSAFVVNQTLNTVACLTEIMCSLT